jgi:hypothetical protein
MFKNHRYYNCEITLDNGETYRVGANWLHNEKLDDWFGWTCDAGHKRISIDKDFDVRSAVCHNDYLGNIFTGWDILPVPTVCKKDRCTGCTDDLLITKKEPK